MILTYSDKEVDVFHPLCSKSLNKAMEILGIDNEYEVIHHKAAGQLEMDFAIANKLTGKILCIVEVKRTPSAVKSSRYQYQAMSYIQQTPSVNIERPYYMLTNIECSCLFKYNSQKPNVHQQILEPGLVHNLEFKDINTEEELIELTSDHYASLLRTAVEDSGRYIQSIDTIISLIMDAQENISDWNSQFARLAYEYIRGAFDGIERNLRLKDIRQYDQKAYALKLPFKKIDFKGIFDLDDYSDLPHIDNRTLSDMYSLGKSNIDADEIVTSIHQLISADHEIEGEVPTDIELARLMCVVGGHFKPEIKGCICDPAAGSGNLLSCVNEVYRNIRPSQIKANDKNPLLLQLLSLRLGLKYPQIITPGNAPSITCNNITELQNGYFKDTDLILVNPPMVASVACQKEKKEIHDRIRQLGSPCKTNVGQSPLEAAFLELLNLLTDDGCITVALLPKTHLTSLGEGMIAFRRFLLEDFGLCLIFNYPGTGLFEKVTKSTVLVAGCKGHRCDNIAILNSFDAVADINLDVVTRILKDNKAAAQDGIECTFRTYHEMQKSIDEGWIRSDSITTETIDFLNGCLTQNPRICTLKELSGNIYRGKAGNNGLNELLYISSNEILYDSLSESEKKELCAGMKNARHQTLETGQGDHAFLDCSKFTEEQTDRIISKYLSLEKRDGKQQKKQKSKADILKILKKESASICASDSILLPRDLRRFGRIYRCSQPTFVSTNFFIIGGLNTNDSMLMASWMSTVFYQLSCEAYGKNQEGTRKMEKGEICRTHIPVFSRLSPEEQKRILTEGIFEGFVDLQYPEIRKTDRIWAEVLFGKAAQDILDECLDLLLRKATNRNR